MAAGAARRRKAKDFHDLFILTALGIARESATLVLKRLSFFTSITVFLIIPVSAATIISKAFTDHLPVTQLALQIQALCFTLGYPNLIYQKLSETVISYMVCFPFVVTFSLVARAAVAHTVAYLYAGGNSPSWQKIIQAIPKLWKGLVVTYIWGCLIVFGYSVLIFGFLLATVNLVILLALSTDWVFWTGLCWGIVYSIGFAHAIALCNLATIVCVLEDGCSGMEAVCRAKFLIRGRTQVALLIVVITGLGLAFVEGLFQYRVMVNDKMDCFGAVSEASLLIFMYSLVSLLDVVMNCVFYYTCKVARLEGLCLDSPFFTNSLEE
ncbi:hypothetical protein SUGI_0326130 [Cryptomeria japonica]|uniref:uncharacterized protein LOC131077382 n=1 Tax=Cryptomeria japonica TaxID=3369 RepID=UPI002408CC6F|nr:uncharacterized protein LOC131077382 [Cryptomeria japonica]GLJ18409.1 hypothetical protein SUGI_0326130 [Cryptomeria japonica]